MIARAAALSLLVGCAASGAAGGGEDLGDAGQAPDPEGDAGNAAEDASGPDASSPDDAGSLGPPRCEAMQLESAPPPLEMLVVFDRSVSMQQDHKWEDSLAALASFSDAAHPTEVRVGVQFFPNPAIADACRQQDYRYPLIPLQAVDHFSMPLKDGAQKFGAWGADNPLHPALAGGLDYLTGRAQEAPSAVRAVLVLTDGMSEACGTSLVDVATLAATGIAQGDRIPTYVVGLSGADAMLLDEVARQGGTARAAEVVADADAQGATVQALLAAEADALRCERRMPVFERAKIDVSTLRVRVTSGAGANRVFGPLEPDACAAGEAGFRFDRPLDPARIELCGEACAAVKADAKAKITFDVGCVWVVQ